ncbi:MAG: DUF3105 domain-containing protein [Chloroflexi bacterium]|nr:DUF3105 domain-containing protein [Chloroflexota bacterium]
MARRRGTRAAVKLERRREARQERQRIARRRRWIRRSLISGGVLLVVGGVAALIVLLIVSNTPSAEVAARRVRIDDEGRLHVPVGTPIEYANVPPASGTHYPITAPYGVYERPVEEGLWVHNLEHGAIALLYRCDTDCDEVVPELENIYADLPNAAFGEVKLIALPYAGLVPKYMLVAWHWQEPMDSFDPDRVREFYRDYVDRGPEAAP